MGLIEIYMVGLQSFERVIDSSFDPRGRQALAAARHLDTHLGHDHKIVAPAALGEPASNDGLGFAALMPRHPARIDVSGVDRRQTGIDHHVEEPETCRLVGGPAEHVAAEDEWRDVKRRRAEAALLHRYSTCFSDFHPGRAENRLGCSLVCAVFEALTDDPTRGGRAAL